jgi:hypothetical protein
MLEALDIDPGTSRKASALPCELRSLLNAMKKCPHFVSTLTLHAKANFNHGKVNLNCYRYAKSHNRRTNSFCSKYKKKIPYGIIYDYEV